MSDLFLLLLIIVLLVCLVVTVGGLLLYSGLLSDIVIRTGPPPIRNVTIAYKFKEGPYKDCGAAYTESCSIGPKLNAIGVFYDDPKQRPPEKCRYVVGSILCEGEEKPDEDLQKLYEKFGFKVLSLPEVSHAVTTSFPCTTPLSHVLGPYRVYPRIASYIEERKLCAFPNIEIYRSDVINYMVPLSRQTDFFVPEMKEEVRTDVKEEDSDDDRGTDITEEKKGSIEDRLNGQFSIYFTLYIVHSRLRHFRAPFGYHKRLFMARSSGISNIEVESILNYERAPNTECLPLIKISIFFYWQYCN
uniref:Testis expressed 264, ER-phagy receptor a n=1 Tax=Amphilophus citrinellus TaxID=61819 RepID=A0A3Q0SPV2_AMPCI